MSKAKGVTKTGETVTIACKLPHGLTMRVYDFTEGSEPVMGGGSKAVKVPVQKGEAITIHGNTTPFGQQPKCQIIGGYALTEGVPADFWEMFEKQNKDAPFIVNKLVFAHDRTSMASGEAEENSSRQSGLQPIQLDSKGQVKDARAGKKINTADEQPKPAPKREDVE